MPLPGFIPTGDKFYATIRRPGLEEIIEDNAGAKLTFPSAAAATLHAKKAIDQMAIPPASAPETQEEIDARIHAQWKHERAEMLRAEREAFDMRNVKVVSKKRRKFA